MSTITAIVEPDAAGVLHLQLPSDAPRGKLKVTATLESAGVDWPARRGVALKALERLAARGGIRSIPDPAAWQRGQRADRVLPGRQA